VFRHPAALRDLVLHQDIKRLGEAYLAGQIDVTGDLETVFSLTEHLEHLRLTTGQRLKLACLALQLPRRPGDRLPERLRAGRHQRRNSRDAIAHHYDLGNDFYRQWLDPQMVYSCAYFRDAGQPLAEAQADKLDYICRKLRLEPGQSLLDIGCGWGALILHAARHYGVTAHGITLSEQQYRLAGERIAQAGLSDRVTVALRDYRELSGEHCYDRIVSVGMFEHVGVDNFPVYFGTVRRLLRHDGLFLNHGITNDSGWQRTPLTDFINEYVFPDGELTRISTVQAAMEDAGFEILDVESLRRHYALTLRHWVRNLDAHREAAIAASSEATFRLWKLYMAGSAFYFDEGSLNVYQVLAAPARGSLRIPLRRDDLYH
jgi:cyclopropane-fatty-acyl-phospholipid synthase